MNLRKKHSKKLATTQTKTKRVICDTEELRSLITNWMENDGWSFENFADFLELAHVCTPVKLSSFNEKDRSFKCIAANNKEFIISIRFGSFFDTDSELHVTYGEYKNLYHINMNLSKEKTKPSIRLFGRRITKEGIKLFASYSEDSLSINLNLSNTHHILDVFIDGATTHLGKSSPFWLQNFDSIEDYLINLDTSLKISDVYNTIIKLLEFSSDDIAKCKRIAITLTKGIVRNKLNFSYGILQEYTTTENNETFTVCKNGYWSYHSDNISIEAPLKSNPVIHIAYSEDEPYNGNLSETIARVTRTINSLKHLFKEN